MRMVGLVASSDAYSGFMELPSELAQIWVGLCTCDRKLFYWIGEYPLLMHTVGLGA